MKSFWIHVYSALLIVLTFTGFKTLACEAQFSYTILSDISELTVDFHNESIADDSIMITKWTFGDGQGSAFYQPEHQYLSEGIYIVTLNIVTKSGCHSTFTDTIELKSQPPSSCYAAGSYLPDTTSSYTYSFQDHSSVTGGNDSIHSWIWNFDDGTPDTNAQHIDHTFPGPGQYYVSLTIYTDSGCSSSTIIPLDITASLPPCAADFTTTVNATNPLSIHFHDESISINSIPISSWEWTFGDADTVHVQDVTHVFPHAGVYDIKLKIVTPTCKDSMTIQKVVGTPQKYNMWGHVYAGPYPIDKCIAYLYMNFQNKLYVPVDTVELTSINDTLGVYYFYQKLEGQHVVKLLLPDNSQYAEEYVPTYFGNEVYWENASNLSLFSDVSQAHIHLAKEQQFIQSGGQGYIAGKVYSNNSNYSQKGVEVLLLNTSGDILESTFSGFDGGFEFNDVPFDDYIISSDITGMKRIPMGIQLSSTNDSIFDIELFVNHSTVTGLYDLQKGVQKLDVKLFPNPATDQIKLITAKSDNYSISLLDIHGREIKLSSSIWINKGAVHSFDLNELNAGIYILKIESQDKTSFASKKLIVH